MLLLCALALLALNERTLVPRGTTLHAHWYLLYNSTALVPVVQQQNSSACLSLQQQSLPQCARRQLLSAQGALPLFSRLCLDQPGF